MRASEYIAALEALVDEHGDLEVEDSYGELMSSPEHIVGDEPAVFVLAENA